MKTLLLLSLLLVTVSQICNAEQSPKEVEQLFKIGQETFRKNCTACHGERGDGQGPAAAAITGAKPRDFTKGVFKYGKKPAQIFKTITKGSPNTAMPSWASLTTEERWGLVTFVMSLGKNK